jgi:hypothetical protein
MSTPTIDVQLTELVKEAMRNKDQRAKDCIAMIKTKHMERRTSAGFKGPLDDSLWLEVIGAYSKQLKKARDEYAALGEAGKEHLPQLDFEIEFCARFLPKLAGDDEVKAYVKETLARLAVTDPKQAGRVMGEIMKAKKGVFDAGAVKRLVEEALGKPA